MEEKWFVLWSVVFGSILLATYLLSWYSEIFSWVICAGMIAELVVQGYTNTFTGFSAAKGIAMLIVVITINLLRFRIPNDHKWAKHLRRWVMLLVFVNILEAAITSLTESAAPYKVNGVSGLVLACSVFLVTDSVKFKEDQTITIQSEDLGVKFDVSGKVFTTNLPFCWCLGYSFWHMIWAFGYKSNVCDTFDQTLPAVYVAGNIIQILFPLWVESKWKGCWLQARAYALSTNLCFFEIICAVGKANELWPLSPQWYDRLAHSVYSTITIVYCIIVAALMILAFVKARRNSERVATQQPAHLSPNTVQVEVQ
eukprot:TRINITY_DN4704_c0_g1_i3.p1 TRINITY_DN4704_c0_g1~~TRINITY_DN4704_c0_g1_i3.p1  ORF type:complete len:312 (-),score=62.55 TRINITY_DN4704_c0_g1_i3:58-993(-)